MRGWDGAAIDYAADGPAVLEGGLLATGDEARYKSLQPKLAGLRQGGNAA